MTLGDGVSTHGISKCNEPAEAGPWVSFEDEPILRSRLVDEIEWRFRRAAELRKSGLLRHLAYASLAGLRA